MGTLYYGHNLDILRRYLSGRADFPIDTEAAWASGWVLWQVLQTSRFGS
jgi:hypothetical protein